MELKLLYAKDAIFSLIAQFHRASKFDDGELYIYNYCESALEHAFSVLGIEQNYIKLMDFCKLWEDNTRAIRAINFPDRPFDGITADIYYQIFKEDFESWEKVSAYLNENSDFMMNKEEMQEFRKLFSKYCRQEINRGHCQEDCCDICPVNNAYDEIFNRFADEEDDEDEE